MAITQDGPYLMRQYLGIYNYSDIANTPLGSIPPIQPTNTAIAGAQTIWQLTPTYNQASGSGANTDFLINRTNTAIMSGAQKIVDLQVGGTSVFYVSGNTAPVTVVPTVNITPPADALASGTSVAFSITPTHNQTSTAGSTNFLINRTNTAVGSGTSLFLDLQIAAASVFSINGVTGAITSALVTNAAASGTPVGISYARTYNQTSTAGSTDLSIVRTETGVGSGTHSMIRCLTGAAGTTLAFAVLNDGTIINGSAALATTATGGFFQIASMAGTPTGNFTAASGMAPMVYDSTAHKIWVKEGTNTWKYAALT